MAWRGWQAPGPRPKSVSSFAEFGSLRRSIATSVNEPIRLDTVAYSRFTRGEPRIVALLDAAEWIGLQVTVLGQIHAGFEGGQHKLKNLGRLNEVLSAPVVEVLPVDRRTAEVFGAIILEG